MCGELGVRLWTQIVAGPAYIQKLFGRAAKRWRNVKKKWAFEFGKPLLFNARVSCQYRLNTHLKKTVFLPPLF